MSTIFSADERARLNARLERLTPESRAEWGSFTATAMLCHLISALEGPLGPEPAVLPKGGIARNPLKWLIIHLLPWPKGKAESPPELLTRAPGSWTADTTRFRQLLEQVGTRDPAAHWPASPAFGPLTGRTWGVLLGKHIDHHFRQFGV